MITLPFEYIAAAKLAAAHQDVRFYLVGVKIGNGVVAGTNGHIAVIIEDESLKDVPEMIIPKDTVEWLIKKVGKRNANRYTAEISDMPGMEGFKIIKVYSPDNGLHVFEIFRPIDGKYPDVMRVLVKRDKSGAVAPSFNFDYIKIMAEARQVLTGSRIQDIQAFFGDSANDVVYFPLGVNDAYHGLVMPMRT